MARHDAIRDALGLVRLLWAVDLREAPPGSAARRLALERVGKALAAALDERAAAGSVRHRATEERLAEQLERLVLLYPGGEAACAPPSIGCSVVAAGYTRSGRRRPSSGDPCSPAPLSPPAAPMTATEAGPIGFAIFVVVEKA